VTLPPTLSPELWDALSSSTNTNSGSGSNKQAAIIGMAVASVLFLIGVSLLSTRLVCWTNKRQQENAGSDVALPTNPSLVASTLFPCPSRRNARGTPARSKPRLGRLSMTGLVESPQDFITSPSSTTVLTKKLSESPTPLESDEDI
jgi:hypothetical protein